MIVTWYFPIGTCPDDVVMLPLILAAEVEWLIARLRVWHHQPIITGYHDLALFLSVYPCST